MVRLGRFASGAVSCDAVASQPIAFSIFGVDVRWYALLCCGRRSGVLLAQLLAARIGLDPTGLSTPLPGSCSSRSSALGLIM